MVVRRASRKDANHADIAALFKRLGWSVLDLGILKNCCDLCVSKNGVVVMVEVKDGSKPPSARKLTPGEQGFRDTWQGEWRLVENEDDVIAIDHWSNHLGA